MLRLIGLLLLCMGVGQIAFAQNQNVDPPTNGIVTPSINKDRRPLPYPAIRESEILWEKHLVQIIDTREKLNLPFRNEQRPFAKILVDGVLSGAIPAYSVEDDQFTYPLDTAELSAELYRRDTLQIWDYTEDFEMRVVENDVDFADFERIRIKEVWYFDTNLGTLKSRIIGIAPLKVEYDDRGDFKYERPLFWVNFQQIRPYLAKFLVPNSGNDRGRLNWQDILEMRQFSSYVMKECNIFDRRLQDYLSGVDRLYEAEKIMKMVFNREMDHWSY